jgi:hypothetical protein
MQRVTKSLHNGVTATVDGAGEQKGRAGKVRAAQPPVGKNGAEKLVGDGANRRWWMGLGRRWGD